MTNWRATFGFFTGDDVTYELVRKRYHFRTKRLKQPIPFEDLAALNAALKAAHKELMAISFRPLSRFTPHDPQ